MAASTIISHNMLIRRLSSDVSNANREITDARFDSTGFVNTWAQHYDPFDEYQASPEITQAPRSIVFITYRVAEAMYHTNAGVINRDGNEQTYWEDVLEKYKKQLMEIQIEPVWVEQTVALDGNNAMAIGDLNGGGYYPRVLPVRATVTSAASNTWLCPDDWCIKKGGQYTDEDPGQWYLYSQTSSLEGTLRYMRTYRNDGLDYGRYGEQ